MSNALFPTVKGLTLPILKTAEFSTIVQKSAGGATVRIPQMQNPLWHFTLVFDYLYDTFYSPNNTQAYAPYTDLQTLMGFYTARHARSDDFLLFDPSDYTASGLMSGIWQAGHTYGLGTVIIDVAGHAQQVTTPGISGNFIPAFNHTGGTTADGGGTLIWTDQGVFPLGFPNAPSPLLLLTDSAGIFYSPLQRTMGGLFAEDITDLVPGTLNVYANGVLQTSGYSVLGPGLALPGVSFGGLYLQWLVVPATPVTATFQFYFRVCFEQDTQDFERTMQGLWTIGGSMSKNGSGYLKLETSRPPGV
jgi:Conserved hypothetical protein 2217 (DUF2460)